MHSTQVLAAPAVASIAPGLCLLVVEDDLADAYLIERALSDLGSVVHARNGAEALDMVERGEVAPDLAFIDLHMPVMSGFDLLTAFASRTQSCFPMVVLTTSSPSVDAIRSRLMSAVRVVTKPDTVAEMHAVLKRTVEAVCRPVAGGAEDGVSLGRPGR